MRSVSVSDKDLLQGFWGSAICRQRHEPCINLYYIQLVDCRRVETFGLVKVVVSSRFFNYVILIYISWKLKTQTRLDFFYCFLFLNVFLQLFLYNPNSVAWFNKSDGYTSKQVIKITQLYTLLYQRFCIITGLSKHKKRICGMRFNYGLS